MESPTAFPANTASSEALSVSSSIKGFPATLSQKVWGIQWDEFVPFAIGMTGVTVERARFEDVEQFAKDNFRTIYGEGIQGSVFLASGHSEGRANYYREVGDFFVFRDNARVVGVVVGSLLDWSAYYVRNMAVLPEYQGKGLVQIFWDRFFAFLSQFEIARIEADVAPSNHANIHVLTKMKFHIIGFVASEMWGSTVRLARYLDPEHHNVFLKQFCLGSPPTDGTAKQ